MINICLETEHLILKVLDASYADKVLDYYLRNQHFLEAWEPKKALTFYSVDYQSELLSNELKKIQDGKLFKVWLFSKEDTDFNKVLGSIALNEIVRGCFQSCFLGYKIDESFQNKGYMSEAVNKITDYAFNKLDLHRIEANIMPRNLASIKVVEKNGYINEGVSKKYLKINDVWEDHIHMIKLNEL